MTKFQKGLLYLVAILAIANSVYFVVNQPGQKKVVYVDIGKLLDGYRFRKDLQNVAESNIHKINKIIDSLNMVKRVNDSPTVDSVLHRAKNALAQYYEVSNQEATKKIWERLNPSIEAYGKKKHYEIIIGANGAGTVLYGDKDKDITEDLLEYLNDSYEKGN